MRNRYLFVLVSFGFFLLHTEKVQAFWWFPSKPKTLQEQIQEFQKEQIQNPNDPITNYNLGVALYKTGKYSDAINNFDRAATNSTDKILKKQSYFNLANTLYKNVLNTLPENWEDKNKKTEDSVINNAINDIKRAISSYDHVLSIEPENIRAKTNKQKATELLKKLEEKQEKQKKEEKDKQEQKKEQGQNKNQKDKQEQKQEQSQKDQAQKDQKQQEQKKEQEQGQNKNQKDKQEQKQEQQQATAQIGVQKEPQESIEKKALGAVLDDLQRDESQKQKALMLRQVKGGKHPQSSNQKPW